MSNHSTTLRFWIDRHNAGDPRSTNELLKFSEDRFMALIRARLRASDRLRGFEGSADVLVGAQMRFAQAMRELRFDTLGDFLRLGATMIHRQLADFAKHYFGPNGPGAREVGLAFDPAETGGRAAAARHLEIADAIERLPPDHRQLVELRYYLGLSQADMADALGLPVSTLKRRWVEARLAFRRAYRGPDAVESADSANSLA